MNGARAKAMRRDLRRAFGDGMVETLERRDETLENLLKAFGAVNTVLIDIDKRLDALEARTFPARIATVRKTVATEWREFLQRISPLYPTEQS